MFFQPSKNRSKLRRGFSLVEVVIAVGIFAVAVISIIGLLLPNTKAVDDQRENDVARRLSEFVQGEMQRHVKAISANQKNGANAGEGLYDFDRLFYLGAAANRSRSLFLVATRDGSRVLVTGEDPYEAWADTYDDPYLPAAAANYRTVPAAEKLAAENNLSSDDTPGNPAGIAFRDRYFLIEVFLPTTPKHRRTDISNRVALPFVPLGVRVVWPYRLPAGPATPTSTSKYDDYDELPWLVAAPAQHSVYTFNMALTP